MPEHRPGVDLEEFVDEAARLRKSLPEDQYPFAYNRQGNGVTRWLSWLFEADGRFLEDELVTPAPMVVVFLLAQRWFVQGLSHTGLP